MFNPFDHEDLDLDTAISNAHVNLMHHEADTDEYQKIVNQLTKLYALKEQMGQLNLKAQIAAAEQQLANDKHADEREEANRPFFRRVDPNTALIVAGNIFIGLAVIKYEQTGVIGTKVMSFMKKI